MYNFFSSIPEVDEPPSMGLSIFKSWVKKELSDPDYFIANAMWMANNLGHYRGQRYEPISQNVFAYINRRLSDSAGYDEEISKKVGAWISSTYLKHADNMKDLETLLWAKSKCESVNLQIPAEKLQAAIDHIACLYFPAEDFAKALEIQKRDSEIKPRKI